MFALSASDAENESDEKYGISINKDYANTYDTWRRKEEFQKLKDRYGKEVADQLNNTFRDSSSSDEEDENASEWTEENEKDFLKTLSYLKKKDPVIYDDSVRFFKNEEQATQPEEKIKKKTEKPLFLRDYKRKLILKESTDFSDEKGSDAERQEQTASPTLVEEERAIKESLMSSLKDCDGDEDKAWGGLFQKRNKTQQELDKENEDYLEWLNGQREHLGDEKVELELRPLREYWNDPKLDEGEKFLRDYILNKRFLDGEDNDHIPTYEEIVHDSDENLSGDEQTLEQQEDFEHKFNFRFEEPDQEFLKRYPRVMENTLRRKDDRRKVKRAEWREKKEKAKLRKIEEVKQLKALKRKELEERIQKLKEITGNAELGFKDEDLEGDFDPSEYDKRMKQLFNEEFYEEEQEIQKPVFPDLDRELELENWDQWDGNWGEQNYGTRKDDDLHCEDPNFNMDCDYDPKTHLQEFIELTHRRRKRKRQSKFAEAVAVKKPVFDPQEKSFDEYLEEYYSLDFEDVIGDLPCRFKYRKVVPNSFGLTVEEILNADDKELNSWCSLRKTVQFRPEAQELFDIKAYQAKAKKEHLKKKYLKSLYAEEKSGDVHKDKSNKGVVEEQHKAVFAEMQGVDGSSNSDLKQHSSVAEDGGNRTNIQSESPDSRKKQKNKNKKHKLLITFNLQTGNTGRETLRQNVIDSVGSKLNSKKCKKHKRKTLQMAADLSPSDMGVIRHHAQTFQSNVNKKHFVPRKSKSAQNNQDIGISDARLRAYGIRPKKFKNKLKYGNKSGFK